MNRKIGAFVISLDFELLWGVFDKIDFREYENYFLNTRNVIPEILRAFGKNNISCTWATVGMLFNNDWDEWKDNIPALIPKYENTSLSAYDFGERICSRQTEKFCFAPELVKMIGRTRNQELATHTYSHYYCLEKGQTIKEFEADMLKAKQLAEKSENKLKSLVFPRNQFNADYLKVCKNINLTSIRSNPSNWYWNSVEEDSLKQKIYRTLDAYTGKKDKDYDVGDLELYEGITAQKASRFLRPYSSNNILNRIRLKRILSEMEESAKKGTIYHLWWHPHNFGANPLESMKDLKIIISKYKELENKYDFQSLSMDGVIGSNWN